MARREITITCLHCGQVKVVRWRPGSRKDPVTCSRLCSARWRCRNSAKATEETSDDNYVRTKWPSVRAEFSDLEWTQITETARRVRGC